jgi:glutamyl-tRNA synthetase
MHEAVRVRFAPSPTGLPHLGNMRTALFNWLFARHYGGAFVIRIEDTDVARQMEGATGMILEGLRWLGLDWDEGPDRAGQFGPYYQSQRLSIYQDYARQLLQQGHAYHCYCAPERLEAMRRQQERHGEPPCYDRRCRDLPQAQARAFEREGITPVIRFMTPLEGETSVHDLLRGNISFPNSSLDDFVLLKSDGYPTYHLANMVDDRLMEISHVLRGEEWIPSTPRHVLLYEALGWEPPHYIHLPLILQRSGGKMSKRLGDVSLASYQQKGYLPEAIVNYLALLGWSAGDTREILTLEELVAAFSWQKISVSPAFFDLERLNWFNKWYVRHLAPARIAEAAGPYLREAYGTDDRSQGTAYTPQAWRELLVEHVREEVDHLDQIPGTVPFLFRDGVDHTEQARAALSTPMAKMVVRALADSVASAGSLDLTEADSILRQLRTQLKAEENLAAREVMFPLRASLTGSLRGPSLAVITALLGKERCIRRLKETANSSSAR